MAKRVKIDIVSDTVCPWCFIGKRRLEKAISRQKELQFDINWHPFQLNPAAPKEGRDKRNFYKEKFGSRASSIVMNMTETFAQEGLQYNMDGLTGNTFNSHRLIRYAGRQGKEQQNNLVEELFRAYFTQGKYINDPEILLQAAHKAGVSNPEMCINDESVDAVEVQKEIAGVRGHINGVPHFIIDGRFELSGAQDPSAFEAAFAQA